MLDLLAQVLPLTLAAAISPILLMGSLTLLGGPKPLLHAGAFAVGVAVTTVILLLVGVAAVNAQRGSSEHGPFGSPVAHGLIGLLLIATAVLFVARHSDGASSKRHQQRLLNANNPAIAYVGIGALLMAMNASTIVVLIAILHEIARAGTSASTNLITLAIVAVIATLPATAPLLADACGGPSVTAKVTQLGGWTARNGKYILAALFLALGAQDLLQAFGD